MLIIADTHVHFYPCYDLHVAFGNLVNNLGNLGGNAVRTAFLVERSDCHYFADMMESKAEYLGAGFEISSTREDGVAVLLERGEPILYLFSGRQIATAERIEILALTVDIEVAEDMPAEDVVKTVLDSGGIPVLSWAPGKWFFGRKKVVRQLIDSFGPGKLLIGDTTLRPTVCAEPLLMRVARSRGFAVVAGSDPLPFSGEERYMGSYAAVLDGPFDPDKPVSSIRRILSTPDMAPMRAGKRCGLLEVIRRLKRRTATKRG